MHVRTLSHRPPHTPPGAGQAGGRPQARGQALLPRLRPTRRGAVTVQKRVAFGRQYVRKGRRHYQLLLRARGDRRLGEAGRHGGAAEPRGASTDAEQEQGREAQSYLAAGRVFEEMK